MPNVQEIIRDHVSLSISCIDRLYVNGYMPALQTSGQLCDFMRRHLGQPIPSPAVLRPLHDGFVRAAEDFAGRGRIPLVGFERGQHKDDLVNARRARFDKREGVVMIGVAQERAWSFKASKRRGPSGGVHFDFSRQLYVKHYYFYVEDPDWGPATATNGPRSKCAGSGSDSRPSTTASSPTGGPIACNKICDSLGPEQVQAFFDRWSQRLPWPLTPFDRRDGYEHRLWLWQMEVSLTQIFDEPIQGRHFFEEVVRENLDLGRPLA